MIEIYKIFNFNSFSTTCNGSIVQKSGQINWPHLQPLARLKIFFQACSWCGMIENHEIDHFNSLLTESNSLMPLFACRLKPISVLLSTLRIFPGWKTALVISITFSKNYQFFKPMDPIFSFEKSRKTHEKLLRRSWTNTRITENDEFIGLSSNQESARRTLN